MPDIPQQGDANVGQVIAAPAFAPSYESFAPTSYVVPTRVEAGSMTIPPTGVAAYDAAVSQVQPLGDARAQAEVPAAFKEIANVQADLEAPTADRVLSSGERPQINVQAVDDSKAADIRIDQDGSVHVAKGLTDAALRDYNVQVAEGVDPKITEAVLSALAKDIQSKSPDTVPRIDSAKDSQGRDLVSSEFRDQFRSKDKSEEDKLPENPQMPAPGGGGGGGGGGGEVPKPDQPLKETDDEIPNRGGDDQPSNLNGASLRDLSSRLGDMNAMQYGNFMSSMLPQELLDQLGPPPWSPEQLKKLQAYLKSHPDAMKKGMSDSADELEKAGDPQGAKAIKDFSADIAKDQNGFADKFTTFLGEAQTGNASPTDVHKMFAGADGSNNNALENGIRGLQLLDAARKYDRSNADGGPDLSKINDADKGKLIADLQMAPQVIEVQPATPKRNGVQEFVEDLTDRN